jgi:ribose-phosphate pyrophosphokinase
MVHWQFVHSEGSIMETPYYDSNPFAIVSSPGMHGMARDIKEMLESERGVRFPHHEIEYTRFSNEEYLPRIPNTVRRQRVFFLHPLQEPDPNTAIMMMLLANDALKRASVSGITLVVPYIPYLRQDRKDRPRVPISARMLADIIESNMAVERIITIDMHAEQEQGFFSIPVDNLTGMKLFADHFAKKFQGSSNPVQVVSPDFGGAVRSRRFAARLGNVPVAIIEKRRPAANVSEIVSVIGESVAGKEVVIFDDMIDTGGTLRTTARALREMGAAGIHLSATHGILSADACAEFSRLGFSVACTDSIPRDKAFYESNPWLNVVSIERLLADAMFEASLVGGSLSKLST